MRLLNGLIIVTAEIDGRTGDFILDSGAPMLVLNRPQFAEPTSSLIQGFQLRGVNGTGASFSTYHAESFQWQGISLHDHDVPTLDLTDLARRAGVTDLLGLIGYSLLSPYALTLDYGAQKVTLRQPTLDAATAGVPFVLRGHLPVVEATVNGQLLHLAVDCGAQQNLLDVRLTTPLAGQVRRSEQVQLSGADENAHAVTSGELRKLQLVGGPTFHKQSTVFASLRHLNQRATRTPLDGLIGYPALHQQITTIDYVNNVLQFE